MNKLYNTVGLLAPYRSRCSEPLLNTIFASRTSAPLSSQGVYKGFLSILNTYDSSASFSTLVVGVLSELVSPDQLKNSSTLAARVLESVGRPFQYSSTRLLRSDERTARGAFNKRRFEPALPIGGAGRAVLHRVPGFPFARQALRMLTFAS